MISLFDSFQRCIGCAVHDIQELSDKVLRDIVDLAQQPYSGLIIENKIVRLSATKGRETVDNFFLTFFETAKSYANCTTGGQLVDWLISHDFDDVVWLQRQDAIAFGQRLIGKQTNVKFC